jgi:hypothetical protein
VNELHDREAETQIPDNLKALYLLLESARLRSDIWSTGWQAYCNLLQRRSEIHAPHSCGTRKLHVGREVGRQPGRQAGSIDGSASRAPVVWKKRAYITCCL